ncbi:MFS transporter, partial [Acinetobacter baumannii]
MLGMIGVAQFVPLFVLTPVVGLIADSVDRRAIVRATTALMTLSATTLGVLTWTGHLGLIALYGAAVIAGIVR